MGDDVVHHSGFRVSILFHALGAQRMALKELLGFPLPSAAVATLPCGTGHLGMKRQVFLTVLLTGFHQGSASGLLARYFGSIRHLILLSGYKKSRVDISPPRLCSLCSYFSQGRSALPKCP